MVGQWVIRGACAALVAVCVAAWVGSYYEFVYVSLSLASRDYKEWGFVLVPGGFCWESGGRTRIPAGWEWQYQPAWKTWGWDTVAVKSTYHWGGFGYTPSTPQEPVEHVVIPLWLPSGFAALMLGLGWWKTRRKYNGKGFPVEVGRKGVGAPP